MLKSTLAVALAGSDGWHGGRRRPQNTSNAGNLLGNAHDGQRCAVPLHFSLSFSLSRSRASAWVLPAESPGFGHCVTSHNAMPGWFQDIPWHQLRESEVHAWARAGFTWVVCDGEHSLGEGRYGREQLVPSRLQECFHAHSHVFAQHHPAPAPLSPIPLSIVTHTLAHAACHAPRSTQPLVALSDCICLAG